MQSPAMRATKENRTARGIRLGRVGAQLLHWKTSGMLSVAIAGNARRQFGHIILSVANVIPHMLLECPLPELLQLPARLTPPADPSWVAAHLAAQGMGAGSSVHEIRRKDGNSTAFRAIRNHGIPPLTGR
jgi:hypothetical protein